MPMTKKDIIIQATIALVEESGLQDTSTAKIAEKAAVATGTLFHHFPTKKDLFDATYEYVQKEKMAHISACIESDIKVPFDAAIRLYLTEATTYWIEHTGQFEFTRQYFHSPYHDADCILRMEELHEKGRDVLQQAMSQGLIRSIDIQFLMPIIHGITLLIVERMVEAATDSQRTTYFEEGNLLLWNMLKI